LTVLTDTSVVLNLCVIGQQEVLPVLYGRILAPPVVAAEFQRLASADSRFRGLTFPSFIEQAAPASLIPSLAAAGRLQAGEVAALSLAVEMRADAVLMDELAGRHAALSLGLLPVGLLGMLLDAKQRRLIPAMAPLLERLENEAQFWISPTLRASVLNDAGEAS
jgi:uncharacterized protein